MTHPIYPLLHRVLGHHNIEHRPHSIVLLHLLCLGQGQAQLASKQQTAVSGLGKGRCSMFGGYGPGLENAWKERATAAGVATSAIERFARHPQHCWPGQQLAHLRVLPILARNRDGCLVGSGWESIFLDRGCKSLCAYAWLIGSHWNSFATAAPGVIAKFEPICNRKLCNR